MKKKLSHPIFQLIKKVAAQQQIPAFVVGGFVRDLILNRPSKDIDFVIIGSGIDFAEKIAKEIGKDTKISIYKNFGTAMLLYEDWNIEFVGARKESYRSNSRKPIVENGSLNDDLSRRDFTINSLAISLQKHDYGLLIDTFNGLKDIENKIIRTPLDSDITFSDDPLRMMRAIRFATQLDFTIEETSFHAIKKNAERINIISKERITDELNKIILSKKPSIGFKLLHDSKILPLIFPQLDALRGIEKVKGKVHKDNFYHTIEVLDKIALKSDNLWLRWAALLHDIAKPLTKTFDESIGWTFHAHDFIGAKMIPAIFKQFKLPLNDKMKYVKKMVSLHLRPIALSEENITDAAIRRLLFEAGDDIEDLMLLCQADITSKNPAKVKKFLNNFEIVRAKLKEIEEKDKLRNWQPPISGNDIMKTFRLKPCREVGVIKNAIREAILEGEIKNNYDDAYNYMINKGTELGLINSK